MDSGSLTETPDDDSHAPFSQTPICLFIRGLSLALIAVGVVAGLHYYVGLRLISDPGVPPLAAGFGWALLTLLFLSIPAGFASSRIGPRSVAVPVQWISHLWIGAFGLLLTSVAASDLVVFIVKLVQRPEASSGALWGTVQAAAVLALVIPALAVGFVTARGKAKVERVRIGIKNLGAGFEGLRVVQISDIHIGQTLDGRFLRRVVEQVNALDADIVAITGDLIDGQVRQLRPEVAALKELKAKRGVFFVTGNHEYYYGGQAWEAEVRRHGIDVLHNEHRLLKSGDDQLVLGGVTDYDGAQFGEQNASRPDLAFAGAPAGVPRILLAHQPRSARAASEHQVDLQLSGHTHGGQMFPWMFFVRLQQPVISGLKILHGIQVYTSRGTGYWGPPIRLGPKPEITELTLVRA
jgi:uncharacterized protein